MLKQMYAKTGKNGCELLSSIRHSPKHSAVRCKARGEGSGGGHDSPYDLA